MADRDYAITLVEVGWEVSVEWAPARRRRGGLRRAA
jgi:hypothetical protein